MGACKQSCVDTKRCKSISYFNSKWCSHWATLCTKTKRKKKGAMSARVQSRTWLDVGPKLECDGSAGEVYMKSSRGKVATLEACKQSCVATAGCKSFSYFHSGWCSHWGTHCSKTKWNKKVAMSARVASIKPRTWTDIGAGVECDGSAGEVYMKSSRGKVATLEACKQSCVDTKRCKSISYF